MLSVARVWHLKPAGMSFMAGIKSAHRRMRLAIEFQLHHNFNLLAYWIWEAKLRQTLGFAFPPRSRINKPYLTLSHCWGKIAFLRLQKDNLDILTNSFPISSLPQTFQDAITFTRKIGIQFLWIDSLCILQDSFRDWEQESTLMAKIYGNSSLNLAATAAIDSSKDLFSERNPASLSVCTIQSQ